MLLWALGLTLLSYYLLFYVAHALNLGFYPYDFDQGEGYDVNGGWLLAQGRPIYSDNTVFPYYSSNYPPVFSLLLAPLVAIYGPALATGRLLSAAAGLATAALVGAIVNRQTANRPAALTAGLLYVGSNYVYHVTPLARVNALAALFAAAGLYCCLRSGLGWLGGAVAAFLLALFTKQTMVDAVAAGLLFLLSRDRRSGLVASAAVGLIGLLLWLALDLASGGEFFVNVVIGNVNPFSIGQAFGYYRNFVELHGVLLVLAAWQVLRAVRLQEWGPFELYWLLDRGAQASFLGREPGGEGEVGARLVKRLREAHGPILVEDPGFSLAAGKEVVGNATHLRNLQQAGAWRPDNLVADLAARRFSYVVLDAELYPEPVLEAIGRYYFLFEEYQVNGTRQKVFAPGAR